MITNTASSAPLSKNEKENSRAHRETTKLNTQGDVMFSRRRILKWFGILSTLLIGAAALVPDAFGIPLDLRSWVFLTSIFSDPRLLRRILRPMNAQLRSAHHYYRCDLWCRQFDSAVHRHQTH